VARRVPPSEGKEGEKRENADSWTTPGYPDTWGKSQEKSTGRHLKQTESQMQREAPRPASEPRSLRRDRKWEGKVSRRNGARELRGGGGGGELDGEKGGSCRPTKQRPFRRREKERMSRKGHPSQKKRRKAQKKRGKVGQFPALDKRGDEANRGKLSPREQARRRGS